MNKTFDQIMGEIPEERRNRIEEKGRELLNEYTTLQALRKAQAMTQETLAKTLNVKQENISRLEKRSDMMLSTLKNYVEAMGGKLEITVHFPDQKPVSLQSIGISRQEPDFS